MPEAESFSIWILEENHNLIESILLWLTLKFSDAEIQVWDTILDQLKLEIPIYLLGKTSFYGLVSG
jgi:release factor glutamine methyltransferase